MPARRKITENPNPKPNRRPRKSVDTCGEATPGIIRAPKDAEHPYGRLSNTVLTPNSDLPLDTLALLHYLLSKPENWQVQMGHLRYVLNVGRDKLQRMIEDLEKAGHLVRRRTQGKGGRWIWESTVYEVPRGSKSLDLPAPRRPAEPAPGTLITETIVPISPAPSSRKSSSTLVRPLPPQPALAAPLTAAPEPAYPAIKQNGVGPTTESNKTEKRDSNPLPSVQKRDDRPRLPESQYIMGLMYDYSRMLDNSSSALANNTQAQRLWRASGLAEEAFVQLLHEALARTRRAQGRQGAGMITIKMAYFFEVVKSLLAQQEVIESSDQEPAITKTIP